MEKVIPFDVFVETHGPQLYGSGVPQHLWEVVYSKVTKETLDAGSAFQFVQFATEDEETAEGEEAAPSPVETKLCAIQALEKHGDIWLIDHAWTFRAKQARSTLKENPTLFQRLKNMFGLDPSLELEDKAFWDAFWKSAQTYRLATEFSLDEENCWYFVDEVGMAIENCSSVDDPNVASCPFYFTPSKTAFNLVWCVRSMEEGEVAKCRKGQHLLANEFPERRRLHDLLWGVGVYANNESEAEESEDLATIAERECIEAFKKRRDLHLQIANDRRPLPESSPLNFSYRLPKGRPRRVWTDVDVVRKGLVGDPNYEMVDEQAFADIVWQTAFEEGLHHRLETMCPDVSFISQFAEERTFCNKANMARCMQKVFGDPIWLPVTYDARDELHQFAGDFLWRQKQQQAAASSSSESSVTPLPNFWIVKPPAMARSMDMTISDNLAQLLRMSETGPKVMCEYIANPCTFRGRKFDVRFIVIVRAIHPVPEVYIYNRYWPRFSLLDFSLEDFDVYEKHFTVMNYTNKARMIDMLCEEFEVHFNEAYGAGRWTEVHNRVKEMVKESFEAISKTMVQGKVPNGTGQYSVATYGLDVLIDANFQPKLLEMTFAPDCERALRHQPSFVQDIFRTLFDGVPTNCVKV